MADETVAQERPVVTRAEAKALGLRHYNTGKPCKNGHFPAVRHVVNGTCMKCASVHSAKFESAHPEQVAECKRSYVRRNPEKVAYWNATRDKERRLEWQRADAIKNAERYQQRRKKWLALNQDKKRIAQSMRRARQAGSGGSYTRDDVRWLDKAQRGKCAYCKTKLSGKYHIDHIVPIALGGHSNRSNLQLLCAPCNISKGAKHPVEFAQRRGLLL